MSRYTYEQSREIDKKDYQVDALIMAAMRKADDFNLQKLKRSFPEMWKELQARYNAPGGILEGESV